MIFFLSTILYFLKFFILFKILLVKNPSIANCFEAIFASITWEKRSYIYRYLSEPFRYTEEKGSKTVKRLSDKLIYLVKWSPMPFGSFQEGGQVLWLLLSFNSMMKLN